MAKKALPETTAPTEEKGLQTTGVSTLASAPDFIESGTEGTEHITQDDVTMPRLAIAQKSSPQLDPDSPQFIDGLTLGMFFNTLTGQIYGSGDEEIEFMVVRADAPKYIQFDPDKQGQVLDFNVPANDPRTQFTTDANGKSVKPLATKFYDFVVLLIPSKEVIALSLKSTALKAAKELNGLIRARNKPLYTGRYVITNTRKENSKGVFWVPVIRNAGTISNPARGWAPDAETQALAKAICQSLAGKDLKIDREPGADDGDGDDFPGDAGNTRGM